MKRLAYLTLIVELILVGVAGWEAATPGCGGLIDASAIRLVGFWCGTTIYFTVLLGLVLIAVTLGYIIALHLNPHASLLRTVVASLNFTASLVVVTFTVVLVLEAISLLRAGQGGALEIIAWLAFCVFLSLGEAAVSAGLLGRMSAARLRIVWLGTGCSIGLALAGTFLSIKSAFDHSNSLGFSYDPISRVATIPIIVLAVLLGSSTFLLLRTDSNSTNASHSAGSAVPVARTLAARLLQAVFVACLIGTGAGVLALESPAKWTKFPEISNWNSLKITLQRDGCFGRCPIYKVEIHGDGTVIYDGELFVAVAGHQESRIPLSTVRGLFEQFRKTNYFALSDKYMIMGFDAPTYTTSIEFDGRSKSVQNFDGASVGMPRSLTDLEDAIDRAANTDRWISGG